MTIKAGLKQLSWMAAGSVFLLAVLLFLAHFRNGQDSTVQLAFKAKRVDLVSQMRLKLATAAEAEKSAVMAITAQDSVTFADQARAATVEVEKSGRELRELLTSDGTQDEKDLLNQFAKAFAEFQHIEQDLLDLAVKNTNIKASALAFGPAAEALTEMDTALSNLVEKNAAAPDFRSVAVLAFGAQTGALRIQALLAPHIAEENDEKMNEMEKRMARADQQVRKDLAELAENRKLRGDPDLAKASSEYARFNEIRLRILALSRENTNVRSLSLSLGEKRKVFFQCQDILSNLQQAILEEPIAGVDYGASSNPRHLGIGESGTKK